MLQFLKAKERCPGSVCFGGECVWNGRPLGGQAVRTAGFGAEDLDYWRSLGHVFTFLSCCSEWPNPAFWREVAWEEVRGLRSAEPPPSSGFFLHLPLFSQPAREFPQHPGVSWAGCPRWASSLGPRLTEGCLPPFLSF